MHFICPFLYQANKLHSVLVLSIMEFRDEPWENNTGKMYGSSQIVIVMFYGDK